MWLRAADDYSPQQPNGPPPLLADKTSMEDVSSGAGNQPEMRNR